MKAASDNIKIMGEEELYDRFELSKYFPSLIPEDANFIVCEGDLKLSGDFSLDGEIGEWEDSDDCKQWCNQLDLDLSTVSGLAGVIVDGNLDVDGSLFNFDDECGVLLLVTGGLTAKNLCAGGAVVYILGDSHVQECVYSYYDGGTLRFMNGLKTTIYINEDHNTAVKGKLDAPFRACSMGYAKNSAGFCFDEDNELIIPKALEEKLSFNAREDGIFSAIYDYGTALLKEGDQPRNPAADVWLKKIRDGFDAPISKIPEALRTEEFYCRVAGNLAYLKSIKKIPKQFLTEAVAQSYIQMCVDRISSWIPGQGTEPYSKIRDIPEHFRVKEMFEQALSQDKVRYRYFALIPDACLEPLLAMVNEQKLENLDEREYNFARMDYRIDHAKVAAWHGEYERALMLLEEAKQIAHKIHADMKPQQKIAAHEGYGDARPYYYEGYVRHLQGDTAQARALLKLAKTLAFPCYRDAYDFPYGGSYGASTELIPYNKRINPVTD